MKMYWDWPGPISRFEVKRTHATRDEFLGLKKCLSESKGERDVQSFLEKHPHLLACGAGSSIPSLSVIPQKRLGSECIPDFLMAGGTTWGMVWAAVELKSPQALAFNKKGDPSKDLTHAIRQVLNWRAWLKRNQNYADREVDKGGLGLFDIDPDIPGVIYIGRRSNVDPSTHELQR